MLEDDSPIFIDALKREMEGSNSQNASPREVISKCSLHGKLHYKIVMSVSGITIPYHLQLQMTNRMKSFFINTRRSKEEIVNFKKYIESNKSIMDIVNAVLLVEGCIRSSIKVKDIVNWPTILEAMEKRPPLLTSSIVYRGINCIRRMDADEFEEQKFLKSLWDQTKEAEVVMDETDICPAIYSMLTLNANSPSTRNFLKLFADALDASIQPVPSKVRTYAHTLLYSVTVQCSLGQHDVVLFKIVEYRIAQ